MDPKMIQRIQGYGKAYLSLADLEKILEQRRPSLYVTLHRLVKQGWLKRLRSGVYQLAISPQEVDRIANQLYYPSYLSFESALSRWGTLSQIPYTLTFATYRRSKKLTLGHTEVEFRQLKRELFFGYLLVGEIYLAEREKALLDQLYFISMGKAHLDLEALDLKEISIDKFLSWSKAFPSRTQRLAEEIRQLLERSSSEG